MQSTSIPSSIGIWSVPTVFSCNKASAAGCFIPMRRTTGIGVPISVSALSSGLVFSSVFVAVNVTLPLCV